MPPHGATNEVFKVSPSSDDTPSERKPRSLRGLGKGQRGMSKERLNLGSLKTKLQAGANNISSKLSQNKHDDGYIDISKRDDMDGPISTKPSQGGAGKNSFSKNQVVWYKRKGKEPQQAKILIIEIDDGHPFYTIKLLKSGREKQTDDAHLEPLGRGDMAEGTGQARFNADQIVFHKPSDGSPIYLAQITNVYPGDGQILYDIKLQGSNVEKSAIKESELLDMHEAGGTAPAPASSQPKGARKGRTRTKSPVRGIKKVLSSEGLKEMKRGVKKMSSKEGLEQMKRSLRGKSREKSRDRPIKTTPVRAVPVTKSGLSSSDGSGEFSISKSASSRSLRSNEGLRRGRIKKTNSLEGLREMMQGAPTAGSNSSVDGGRLRRGGVKKSRSMEGMRDMMQMSKNAHPPPTKPMRRAPQPSMSMSSHQSGHRSVRSNRPPPRTAAERNKLDRERGVQRSKSLEGMHPRHLRRPSRERLGGTPARGVNPSRSFKQDDGPVRPPPRTASGRANPLSTSWHGPPHARPRQRPGGQIPVSTDRRAVPLPPMPTSMTPPIRAVKKPLNDDSDSEESSISSVSWQDKPRSFNRPHPLPPKRDAPRPTEITVDPDDASSVSSDDSSWESFRERPSHKQNTMRQRKSDAEPPLVVKVEPRHPPKVVGKDCVSGAELVLETVYSSDEESEHATNLPADFEPEDLFEWAG